MNHEKINQKQSVDIPGVVTTQIDGAYMSVNLCGREPKYFKCINQNGGPAGRLFVNDTEVPALFEKRKEQVRLHEIYNH